MAVVHAAVDVIVDVSGPVIVAVHLNGNDTVGVIDAVDGDAEEMGVNGPDHDHVCFPVHVHGHDHGGDHGHGHVNDHGDG
jgi:hypothetical protein